MGTIVPRARILAIDPGKVTGYCLSDNGRITQAGCLSERDMLYWIQSQAQFGPSDACVIEVPQIYTGERQKGDPNDLIDLAVMVGGYRATAERAGFAVTLVRPRAWKGQLPKDVCWTRVRETLTAEEDERIAYFSRSIAPGLRHNMHDAIGLATWFQGRWK